MHISVYILNELQRAGDAHSSVYILNELQRAGDVYSSVGRVLPYKGLGFTPE